MLDPRTICQLPNRGGRWWLRCEQPPDDRRAQVPVTCDRCGARTVQFLLERHQQLSRCSRRAAAQQLERAGWVATASTAEIKQHAIPYRQIPGSPDWWVPAWYGSFCRRVKKEQTVNPDEREVMLLWLRQDPTAQLLTAAERDMVQPWCCIMQLGAFPTDVLAGHVVDRRAGWSTTRYRAFCTSISTDTPEVDWLLPLVRKAVEVVELADQQAAGSKMSGPFDNLACMRRHLADLEPDGAA